MLFDTIRQRPPDRVCARTMDGRTLTYGGLCRLSGELGAVLPPRALVFALCENSFGSLGGYVGFLQNRAVPLLLDKGMERGLLDNLTETYRPGFFWVPENLRDKFSCREVFQSHEYCLLATDLAPFPLHDDLALLINTSGSTGSPQLVRQSMGNLESNTRSIIQYLEITEEERPVTTLPMQYVYGLSILNTHMEAGATVLLSDLSILRREFWDFFREQGATSFGGVPYTYDMLDKLGFLGFDLPSLRTMTQAGGKLLPELHQKFAEYAREKGKRFVVMYGASEATARMAYLPHDRALEKQGSMGVAILGGQLWLADADGNEITRPDTEGEMIYRGDNVTLGYAEKGEDLAKGDERGGVLPTGDMAKRDADGFYYVTGRKKRFLKISGRRVNLDQTERLIKSQFPQFDCACGGVDDLLTVFVTDPEAVEPVQMFIPAQTGINFTALQFKVIEEIPKNTSGKTLYSELAKMLSPPVG